MLSLSSTHDISTGKISEYLGESSPGTSPIIVIVCGGATVDIETLDSLSELLDVDTSLDKQYPIERMVL